MNSNEIKKLLYLAIGSFPNMQDKDMGPTTCLWNEMLKDIPLEVGQAAVKKVLSTTKFFPTIAEIREAAIELTQPKPMTAMEAWGDIIKAISNFGIYREQEALASMAPQVTKVVKYFGWERICLSEEPDIIRAQFRMAWETQVKRDKEMSVLPMEVRDLITSITKALPEIPKNNPIEIDSLINAEKKMSREKYEGRNKDVK